MKALLVPCVTVAECQVFIGDTEIELFWLKFMSAPTKCLTLLSLVICPSMVLSCLSVQICWSMAFVMAFALRGCS